MTEKIRFEQASLEHMTKQPRERRYALFCEEVLKRVLEGECSSEATMGHLGDYSDYLKVKSDALTHPHSTLIRFYPDFQTKPSEEFMLDLASMKLK